MSDVREVKVPDIGDFDTVDVIEILVSEGDSIAEDDSLLTLESDKASMEIPSPVAGTVTSIEVSVGDQVGEGHVVAKVEVSGGDVGDGEAEDDSQSDSAPDSEADTETDTDTDSEAGGDTEAPPAKEDDESAADTDSENGAAADPSAEDSDADAQSGAQKNSDSEQAVPVQAPTEDSGDDASKAKSEEGVSESSAKSRSAAPPHASPGIRRFARELGVDLANVAGSGRKGRIVKEDVQAHVKKAMTAKPTESVGSGIPVVPAVDFSKFGAVEEKKLSRIRKVSARNLSRSWLNVPHVTQFDEADVTDMEEFRKSLKIDAEQRGVKVTPLAFLMKAAVAALKEFPDFNSSLSPDGESLLMKGYYHLGIAVDTPNGLVVPVIRDVDQKSLFDLAGELGEVSQRAREGKLSPTDIQGASFTISSLGGIGGTNFTPIVNAPEVAILGVARSKWQPVYDGAEFVPRLILPFSVSYDHRVVDGAAGVRFTGFLSKVLSDTRRLIL